MPIKAAGMGSTNVLSRRTIWSVSISSKFEMSEVPSGPRSGCLEGRVTGGSPVGALYLGHGCGTAYFQAVHCSLCILSFNRHI